jgi:biotin carboxyl carrier protein
VADVKTEQCELVDEVAQLMVDFHLAEASLERGGSKVAFRRRVARRSVVDGEQSEAVEESILPAHEAPVAATPVGTPVSSPMTGIYYGAPSPGALPFIKEGERVTAGQIVALIEAMKVFNEVPSPVSGVVLKIVAQSGAVVQPGEPLLLVG